MKRVSNKLFVYFSVLVMVLGFFLPNFNYVVKAFDDVSSNEITFNNVEENIISLDLEENKSKEITISTEGYTLDSCSGGSLVDVSFENGKCIVSAIEYGKTYLTLSYVKNGDFVPVGKTVMVDIDFVEYFDYILNKMPKEYEISYDFSQDSLEEKINKLLPTSFGILMNDERNFDEQGVNVCTNYVEGYNKCYITLGYRYYLNQYETDSIATEFVVTIKDDIPNTHHSDLRLTSIPDQYIYVGETKNLELFGESWGDSNKYFWVSEDNNIAKINTKNQLVGVSQGETTIMLVNKKTFESIKFDVYVEGNVSNRPIESLLSIFNGTVEIDVSSFESFDPNSYFFATTYFDKLAKNVEGVNGLYASSVTCADGFTGCVIDYYYYDSNYNMYTGQTAMFDIVYRGLNISDFQNSYYSTARKKYVYLNKESSFTLVNFEDDVPNIVYDENYLNISLDEDGRYIYTPIKEGITTVEFFVDGYMTSVTLNIMFLEEDVVELSEFYNALDEVNVPFSMHDADLNLINSYLEAYIKDSLDDNFLAKYIKLQTVEVKDKDVQTSLYIDYKGRKLFDYFFSTKFINLKYDLVSDENIYNELIKLKENIKDEYVASLGGSIFLANCYTENDFYDALINQVPLMHDANSSNGLFNVRAVFGGSYRYNNYLLGGVYYDIYIYKDDLLVGVDRTYIKTNFLIDRSVHDNDNQVTAMDYISSVVKDITNEEYVVERIKDNYYRVNGNLPFNVVYDHKELIKASDATVYLNNDSLISLDIDEEYQLEVLYKPFTATYANVGFYSSDTSVFTVDSNGKITAVGKGHAILSFSDGSTFNYYLVSVGFEGNEFIEHLISGIDDDVIRILFSDASVWDDEKELLANKIWYLLIEKYDIDYMGIYSFEVNVVKDQGAYKYVACISNICSDKHEFDYEYYGIYAEPDQIVLDVGDSEETFVEYTEGDLTDLRYAVIDKDVASVDKNGKVTALSAGRTYLKIYDKKHTYVHHIPIVVDLDSYVNNMIGEVKNKTYDIEYVSGDDYNVQRNIAYSVDTEMYLDGYNFAYTLYGDEYSNQYDFFVDFESNTITYTYYLDDKEYKISTKFNFVGFALDNDYFEINVDELVFPSYETVDGGNPVIKSLNDDICTVVIDGQGSSWIKGVRQGFCGVSVSYKGYKKIINVVVDSEAIVSDIFDSIDVPTEIDLKVDEYDVTRRADPSYNDIYYSAVKNYFDKLIAGKEHLNFVVSEVGASNDGDEVTVSFRYVNYDVGYEISYQTDEYVVKLNYLGHSNGWEDIRDSLADTVKRKYVLTNDQMMEYMLSNQEYADLYPYSSFVDDIKSVCKDCNVVQFAWGSADGELGIIKQGFHYMIFKDNEPIYSGDVDLVGSFIVDVEDIDDHHKFESKLKKRIHDAYKKNKEKYNTKLMSMLKTSVDEDEFEYPIELTYVDSNGEAMLYEVLIDGNTFNAVVSVNFVENEEDEESDKIVKVEDIKLNAEILNLTVGDTFDLVATINPQEAANKNLNWISSNSNVVTVVNGKVTAVGSGNAVITVESADGGASTSINVSVIAKGLAGDIDGDGKVNIVDLVKLRKHLAKIEELTGDPYKGADFNKDGTVNIKDLVNMRQHLAK